MPTYKQYTVLVKELNKRVNDAVESVADIVCTKLRECIDEQYYNDPGFYPNIYERTEQFLNSAVANMIGNGTAEIKVDTSKMHYKNGFSADDVVEMAMQSMHGSPLYKTDTTPAWDVFIEWAGENIISLLKKELNGRGIKVR